MVFLVLGLTFKTFLVLLWKHGHSPSLLNLLTHYDPGARYFAEAMTRLFFDRGGFTFTPGSNAFYEIFLVIGFGIEALVIGLLVQWMLCRFKGPDDAPYTSATPP
jgi:hypothetical protein